MLEELAEEWEKSEYTEGSSWTNGPSYHTHSNPVEGKSKKNDHHSLKNPIETPHHPNSNLHRSDQYMIPKRGLGRMNRLTLSKPSSGPVVIIPRPAVGVTVVGPMTIPLLVTPLGLTTKMFYSIFMVNHV